MHERCHLETQIRSMKPRCVIPQGQNVTFASTPTLHMAYVSALTKLLPGRVFEQYVSLAKPGALIVMQPAIGLLMASSKEGSSDAHSRCRRSPSSNPSRPFVGSSAVDSSFFSPLPSANTDAGTRSSWLTLLGAYAPRAAWEVGRAPCTSWRRTDGRDGRTCAWRTPLVWKRSARGAPPSSPNGTQRAGHGEGRGRAALLRETNAVQMRLLRKAESTARRGRLTVPSKALLR